MRSLVVLAAAAALASGGFAPLVAPAVADAAPATDLYVSRTNCVDTGPGTQARPFCSVQAAADVAQAGQTVHVALGTYEGTVTLTHSGTADAPISFVGDGTVTQLGTKVILDSTTETAGLTLSGVHDVHVSGLVVQTADADGIDIVGSSDVTLDADAVLRGLTEGATTASVSVDGASSGVAITRDYLQQSGGYGVHAVAGARQVTVAGNEILTEKAGGVRASGVTGLTVTGNSVLGIPCAPALTIDGATTGTIENNALWAANPNGDPVCAATPLVSVSDGAASTVTTAYNALWSAAPRLDYAWGGTSYRTAAALAAAVPGQAAHDIELPTATTYTAAPPEGSPLIDSADPHAPGVTSLDIHGNPRSADDPHTANSGTGAMDRGAFELQSVLTLAPTYDPAAAAGPAPYHFAVTAQPTDSWGESVVTKADFGDGGGPQPVTGGTASHTYATPGTYTLTTTATNADGLTVRSAEPVPVGTPAAPKVTLTATPDIETGADPTITPDTAVFTVGAGADTWELTNGQLSFGDGDSGGLSTSSATYHTYPHSGTYTATLTTTDVLGRTSTASATITVGDEILPLTPSRAYDSRSGGGTDKVAAHATVKLSLSQLRADYTGVHGVYLTATIVNPEDAGHLIVYPDGTTRPGVSLLNFSAGQTVPNLMLAEAGANGEVDFYNDSAGPVDLLVDTSGIEFGLTPSGGMIGDTYSPVGPDRVLDTRNGTGAAQAPVGAGQLVDLNVLGQGGLPANADAVLLNVTTTDTKAAGHLTAYAEGAGDPGTSSSNWVTGQTVSNLVFVPVTDGKLDLLNGSGSTVDFVADLVGYYHHFGTASMHLATPLTRVLDTRDGTGTGGTIARIGPKQHVKVQLAGHNGVPATGATSADLNITAVSPAANGFLSAYPDGTAVPTSSSLSYRATHTVANAAVTPLGADGAVDLYNGGTSPVDVVIDLSGFDYGYPAA